MESAGEEIVRMSEVSLGYSSQPILTGVNLRVATGEIWSVTGANGQGKSTLLKGLIGELRPIAGERICRSSDFLGYVPQSCTATATLPTTVDEFVRLGFVGLALTRRAREERFRLVVTQCGLDRIFAHPYSILSGGERRRALIARALVRHPRLLALDEPTAGLDEAGVEQLIELIIALGRGKEMATIVVTHDSAFAARVATHCAVVKNGKVTIA